MKPHTPLVLIILDGFGHSVAKEHNAIAAAKTPVLDEIYKTFPHTLISGSGYDVGLPDQQMGNSEVGHLNIGAGRIIYQDLTRIHKAIADAEFEKNPVFLKTFDELKKTDRALHIFGLLSAGGVHSHELHIQALIKAASAYGLKKIYLHAFLDGRDTPPKSAKESLRQTQAIFDELQCGAIASITGRYYAMDRDKRWDRIESAYDMFTLGLATYSAPNVLNALENAYERNETDEFAKPTTIHGPNEKPITIDDSDGVIFMNFRADRARQLTYAFTDKNFTGFHRKFVPKLSAFVCLTQYAANINAEVAFPPEHPKNSLGEYLSELGYTQLRIAETEKYAHVTFFFNGGIEAPFKNEDRILVPSPKVATYDLQPQMSAVELTDQLIQAIVSKTFDVIICNYANADMVGHSGNFAAAVTAIETIDACLGRILKALHSVNGEAIITADHGNAEMMYDADTKQAHTAHTNFKVPFIYLGRPAKILKKDGKLSDIAPTMLALLGLNPPREMTGHSILQVI